MLRNSTAGEVSAIAVDGLFKLHTDVKHNVKVSFYPDGNHKVVISSRPIFLEDGYEKAWDEKKIPKPQNPDGEVRDDSVRRAMQKVYDISRLSQFTHFITWTLDKNHIDRYNASEVSKKLKKFLDNMVQRKKLRYLIIPEFHKDGAIHMHGLIAGDMIYVNSGKKTKSGQRIYNMPQWTLGYSTAIELDGNVEAVSRYITKYISKDFRKIFGNFYYAGGHELTRNPQTSLYDTNYTDINEKEYTKFGTGYKYLELGDYSTYEDNTRAILEYLAGLRF